MLPTGPQPDQEPRRWDDYVAMYEAVLEPFTLQFAYAAISVLGLVAGSLARLLRSWRVGLGFRKVGKSQETTPAAARSSFRGSQATE